MQEIKTHLKRTTTTFILTRRYSIFSKVWLVKKDSLIIEYHVSNDTIDFFSSCTFQSVKQMKQKRYIILRLVYWSIRAYEYYMYAFTTNNTFARNRIHNAASFSLFISHRFDLFISYFNNYQSVNTLHLFIPNTITILCVSVFNMSFIFVHFYLLRFFVCVWFLSTGNSGTPILEQQFTFNSFHILTFQRYNNELCVLFDFFFDKSL